MGFLFVLAMGGCTERISCVGAWKGNQSIVPAPGSDPDIAASVGRVLVEVKPNGSFTMRLGGFDYRGEISYDGGKVVLEPATVLNMHIDRLPENQRISAFLVPKQDGTATLEIKGKDSIVLRRQSN